MRRPNIVLCRELLRQYPEGLTVQQLMEMIGSRESSLRRALKSMPDVYIDRWIYGENRTYAAIWCLHPPPPNCPRPRKTGRRSKRKTL